MAGDRGDSQTGEAPPSRGDPLRLHALRFSPQTEGAPPGAGPSGTPGAGPSGTPGARPSGTPGVGPEPAADPVAASAEVAASIVVSQVRPTLVSLLARMTRIEASLAALAGRAEEISARLGSMESRLAHQPAPGPSSEPPVPGAE